MDLWRALRRGAAKARAKAKATGQPLDDMLISLSASDEQVGSVQDVNAAGKVMTFVCMSVAQAKGQYVVPGSTRIACDGCATECWISPGTRATFDKITKRLVLCMDCAGLPKQKGA
jgi:hypothetical protein